MSKLAANATLVLAAAQALIVLLSAFGLDLSKDQQDALIGFMAALLAILAVWFHPSIPIGRTNGK